MYSLALFRVFGYPCRSPRATGVQEGRCDEAVPEDQGAGDEPCGKDVWEKQVLQLNGPQLSTAIEEVRGVGSKRGQALREAGIETVADLLLRLPRRYLDRSAVTAVSDLETGGEVTVIATVTACASPGFARIRRGRPLPTTVDVSDGSGTLRCVWFQGGQYVRAEVGDLLALSGRVEEYRGRPQMPHPEYEFLSSAGDRGLIHTAGIIPLYATTADMKERGLRSRGFQGHHPDRPRYVPAGNRGIPRLRPRAGETIWMNCATHSAPYTFPRSFDELGKARKRLGFEELYRPAARPPEAASEGGETARGHDFGKSARLVPGLLSSLPFDLTGAQSRALSEITLPTWADPRPMRRLLHGEVGSGKTLVALCAILNAVEAGYQAALMAPTEILAEQHFYYLQSLLQPVGVAVVLLAGGQRKAVREEVLTAIQTGAAGVAVGTHALIETGVSFSRLGLGVVDEQHRFGVSQRARLYGKTPRRGHPGNDRDPDSPVPLPDSVRRPRRLRPRRTTPGRKPVRTELRTPASRAKILEFAANRMRCGERVYIVYPVIEESEKLDLKSAVDCFEEVSSSGPLADFEVGLLHGRMASAEKTEQMELFARGEVQVLVATTVIEVGVDVPEATVMVIEHAERFGLAQLHQLRGRVGRGEGQSYCILIDYSEASDREAETRAEQRLGAFCATNDGFEIARCDLEIRGPGEILGTRQAGIPPVPRRRPPAGSRAHAGCPRRGKADPGRGRMIPGSYWGNRVRLPAAPAGGSRSATAGSR